MARELEVYGITGMMYSDVLVRLYFPFFGLPGNLLTPSLYGDRVRFVSR